MRPHELQQARETLGMTQAELGVWLGVNTRYPERTVRTWESGRAPISGPVARAITLELENRGLRKKLDAWVASEGSRYVD